jgi:hypothetical protein
MERSFHAQGGRETDEKHRLSAVLFDERTYVRLHRDTAKLDKENRRPKGKAVILLQQFCRSSHNLILRIKRLLYCVKFKSSSRKPIFASEISSSFVIQRYSLCSSGFNFISPGAALH